MKKIISLVLMFVLSLGIFVSCGSEDKAYEATNIYLDNWINRIKEQDINNGDDSSQNVGLKILEETTFVLNDLEVDDYTAEANIEVTNKNFDRILGRAEIVAFSKTPLYATDEMIEKYYTDATWEVFNQEKEETRKGKIYFIKSKEMDKWFVDNEKTDINYLFLGD